MAPFLPNFPSEENSVSYNDIGFLELDKHAILGGCPQTTEIVGSKSSGTSNKKEIKPLSFFG